jgi:uncharacterized protein (TIGR03067 family)
MSKEMKTLVGSWTVVHAEMGGKDITTLFANEQMEITDSGYKIRSGENVTDQGSLSYFEGTNALDIRGVEGPNKDKLFRCIYKMEGDNLEICYSRTDRPTQFATSAENQLVLIKWKRK